MKLSYIFNCSVHENYDNRPRGFDTVKELFSFNGSIYWANLDGGLDWEANCEMVAFTRSKRYPTSSPFLC